jgi:hypothetical protein
VAVPGATRAGLAPAQWAERIWPEARAKSGELQRAAAELEKEALVEERDTEPYDFPRDEVAGRRRVRPESDPAAF